MRIAFICAPYSGDIEKNTELHKRICKYAVKQGVIPFAPAIYFTQFLDENDPKQRALGIEMGLAFMPACDEIWVYGDKTTDGMLQEIMEAGGVLIESKKITEEMIG